MTADDVRALLISEIEKAGTAKAWADAHALSQSYVSDVLNGRRDPGDQIMAALGLEKVITYRIVERQEGDRHGA